MKSYSNYYVYLQFRRHSYISVKHFKLTKRSELKAKYVRLKVKHKSFQNYLHFQSNSIKFDVKIKSRIKRIFEFYPWCDWAWSRETQTLLFLKDPYWLSGSIFEKRCKTFTLRVFPESQKRGTPKEPNQDQHPPKANFLLKPECSIFYKVQIED